MLLDDGEAPSNILASDEPASPIAKINESNTNNFTFNDINGVCHEFSQLQVRESIARFINAMASIKTGRDYICKSNDRIIICKNVIWDKS